MADASKRLPKTSVNQINTLVQSNERQNRRKYGTEIQHLSNNMDKNRSTYHRQEENEKSTVKPLLDCLTPAPLLTSKPYSKVTRQHRWKRKTFDEKKFGIPFYFLIRIVHPIFTRL